MLVVLEGLPGAGKTTALSQLKNYKDVKLIDELLHREPQDARQDFYFLNDLQKYNLADENRVNVMDRNFVSTLCYNYCHDKLFGTDNYKLVLDAVEHALKQGTLRHPDLYVFLECPVSESLSRQSTTNSPEWSNGEFLAMVKEFYANYFENNDCRVLYIDSQANDSTQTVNTIRDSISNLVAQSMKSQERL